MNTNYNFADNSLTDNAGVRALVTKQQTAFQKVRGSSALALMVATGYIAIRKIATNAPAEIQAAILDEHGVVAANEDTSKYTPWIKVQFGEPHLDPKETFKDSEGIERRKWVPDRSMEIYHHTMEELEELGVATDDPAKVAAIIMKHGGAAKMARERQRAKSKNAQQGNSHATKERREFFLEETQGPMVDIPLDRPEDAGDFWTLLARPIADSQGFEILGVVSTNAAKALDKMAEDQFAELTKKRQDREREERHRMELEASRKDERERILGGLDVEQRRALINKLAEDTQRVKPAATLTRDENAA